MTAFPQANAVSVYRWFVGPGPSPDCYVPSPEECIAYPACYFQLMAALDWEIYRGLSAAASVSLLAQGPPVYDSEHGYSLDLGALDS